MEKQPKPNVLILISDKTPQPQAEGLPLRIKNVNAKKLEQFNLNPIFAASHMPQEEQDRLYNLASGILIPGGSDVDPQFYGGERNGPFMTIDKDLDMMQLRVVKKTLEDKKPLLGICRGAQILAVACGGKLIPHLPDVTEEKHGVSIDVHDSVYPSSVFHDIYIKPNTKADTIFPQKTVNVPSRHHQAIDAQNPGDLIISGVSPSGIAEVVEHPDSPFHIGLQTHPELVDHMDYVFVAFAKAITVYENSQLLPLPDAA